MGDKVVQAKMIARGLEQDWTGSTEVEGDGMGWDGIGSDGRRREAMKINTVVPGRAGLRKSRRGGPPWVHFISHRVGGLGMQNCNQIVLGVLGRVGVMARAVGGVADGRWTGAARARVL